jgi:predicted RNA-binding Zn-ribbon protein involved in translation (DUF1610 family)
MYFDKKFVLLRNLLRTFGLSQQSADQVVDFIVDLLAGEGKSESASDDLPEFPYELRNHFLSPAELSFYAVLRDVVGSRATISSKVNLADVFWVKLDDKSKFRIYTNKIDRKHVDFLLCDPPTMRPLVGIELDDRSHQREDRQVRDVFVDKVFSAARLPLLHVSVRRAYVAAEIQAQIAPYLSAATAPVPARVVEVPLPIEAVQTNELPRCPKCGSTMILRTAKSGANAGNKFWGCSTYPTCRGMTAYQE